MLAENIFNVLCFGFQENMNMWRTVDFYDSETSVWHCDDECMSLTLSKSIKYTTQKVGSSINYWTLVNNSVSVLSHQLNKYTTLMLDVNVKGNCAGKDRKCGGEGSMGSLHTFCSNFLNIKLH